MLEEIILIAMAVLLYFIGYSDGYARCFSILKPITDKLIDRMPE